MTAAGDEVEERLVPHEGEFVDRDDRIREAESGERVGELERSLRLGRPLDPDEGSAVDFIGGAEPALAAPREPSGGRAAHGRQHDEQGSGMAPSRRQR